MFEVPLAKTDKNSSCMRKVKYHYVDVLRRKHAEMGSAACGNGLPTPECSAAEDEDNGSTVSGDSARARRRKRRIRSVLGLACSDSDYSDYDVDEDEEEDQNYERVYHSMHEKPQETFEVWATDKRKLQPINKNFVTFAECHDLERYAQRRIEPHLARASKTVRCSFDAIKSGQEVIPVRNNTSHHMAHVHRLNDLLHVAVLERQWKFAYRCFCVLIRLPDIDIRSIWGLGVRILHEMAGSDPQIGTSQQFLEWLSSVYSRKSNYNQTINHKLDPVFRLGSRTHTAKFVTTWLWEILLDTCPNETEGAFIGAQEMKANERKSNYLIEKLSEMVLVPPYMDDPEIWFIYALCHLVQADLLSRQFLQDYVPTNTSHRNIASNQVVQHITHAKNYLSVSASKDKNFTFPEKAILHQLSVFESRLYRSDHSSTSTNSPALKPDAFLESKVLDTLDPLDADASAFEEEQLHYRPFETMETIHFGQTSDSGDTSDGIESF
ncbi:LAMI_0B07338g1_1 [Lachancea mirantina]|uniref:LAMI_0B07338g1_1 n=1 Tax=Lachancea mirantina TaxID=1230905 RepID=A0A1G4IX73_9SACH|nr:LAMI_0B07338g1_1 [Lachancea mirantina]